ncbi:protein kinase [Paenibacillus sp. MBLB2552]|uniref:Protein kinase n=1 Tax=Paenibacillus mellifer TaxID=2937794 RepID=A0A9X2BNG7_9BACL|nr:serine/threonine-protein kinase [Paenibacillus mellifer]MCK8486829.1 protein kinase [Paenibacillus mellifer]
MARFVPKIAPGGLLAGRYRIEQILGQGGMSRVYLAEDLKLPGKSWAIKECLTVPGEPVSVAKEVKLLIQLNHHRLPRIVDFIDPDEDGYSYIVMDYIQGVPLDQFIRARAGRLPMELLIRFGLQMAEGLRYLHRHEPPVIHRDVKPANLLVDDKGELQFVDFGIARTFIDGKTEDTVQLGTVGFAAPEQYGDRQSDARTDLYSLGAVLLYMGTGGRFPVWTPEAASALRNHGCERLEPIVTRLLQARPEDRFNSAEEVSEALIALLRRQSEATRPVIPGSNSKTHEDIIENRGRPVLVSVLGASAGAGTTHTAIALAHLLARCIKKVVIVEMDPKSLAFLRLAQLLDEEASAAKGKTGRRFRIGHVDYAKLSARSDFISLLSEGYGCIVCDLGTGRSKELLEEFRRADLSIIVGAGAEWKAEELERFAGTLCSIEQIPPTWRFCVPFASSSGLRRIRKSLHTKNVYGLPADPNPYDPGPSMSHALQEVCENLLTKPKRTSFRFLVKPKT